VCVFKRSGFDEFKNVTIDVALKISEWVEHAQVGQELK
jgi:hypothetical protein